MMDTRRLQREAICRRVAQAREGAGLTPEGLAQHLGALFGKAVTGRDVRRYEKATVPWHLLEEIGRVTGTSKAWLVYGESRPEETQRFPVEPPRGSAEAAEARDGVGHRQPTRGRALVGLALGFLVGVSVQAATGSIPGAFVALVATVLLVWFRGPPSRT
jgi:hypothetical protein